MILTQTLLQWFLNENLKRYKNSMHFQFRIKIMPLEFKVSELQKQKTKKIDNKIYSFAYLFF